MPEKEKNKTLEAPEEAGTICASRHAHHDWLQVGINYDEASGFHWDYNGPDKTTHRDPRVYCYISYEMACDTGLIRHPGRSHSDYDAKVCVSLRRTDSKIRKEIKDIVGERPPILKRK